VKQRRPGQIPKPWEILCRTWDRDRALVALLPGRWFDRQQAERAWHVGARRAAALLNLLWESGLLRKAGKGHGFMWKKEDADDKA